MKNNNTESLVTNIYEAIKKQIITYRMVPGQLLMVQMLAEEFYVSRTPVREALIRLKEEGLVEDAGGRKFKVAPLTMKMIEDYFESRKLIEGMAAEYASMHATPQQLETLEKILEEQSKVNSHSKVFEFLEADQQFHYELVKITTNSILIDCTKRNTDLQKRICYCTKGFNSAIEQCYLEHMAIFNAIKNKDAALARKLTTEHLDRVLVSTRALKDKEVIFV